MGCCYISIADECCMEKVFGLESFREMAMEYDKLKDEGLSIEGKPTQSHLSIPSHSHFLYRQTTSTKEIYVALSCIQRVTSETEGRNGTDNYLLKHHNLHHLLHHQHAN